MPIVYADIIDEGFDVAVRIGDLNDSRLFSRKLAPTGRLLCAAPAYLRWIEPLRQPENLRNVDCLMFTPMSTHPVWHFARARDTRAVRVAGRMASDDIDALIDAARAGCGVLMAADWLVARELRDGTLVPVLADWQVQGEHGVYLLRPSRQHESAKVRAFCDWLIARFTRPPWLQDSFIP